MASAVGWRACAEPALRLWTGLKGGLAAAAAAAAARLVLVLVPVLVVVALKGTKRRNGDDMMTSPLRPVTARAAS